MRQHRSLSWRVLVPLSHSLVLAVVLLLTPLLAAAQPVPGSSSTPAPTLPVGTAQPAAPATSPVSSTSATTINVNTLADTNTSAPGLMSLRSAISKANSDNAGDIVSIDVTGFLLLELGTLVLTGNMTIDNSSGGQVTIDGQSRFGVFQVNAWATVTLDGLTVRDGFASSGGAILNNGSLTITNSTFGNNSASSNGGAIDNGFASSGGAILNNGSLTITNSTFGNNSASSNGGAIDNEGTLTVGDSTFTGNRAMGNGGAIHNGNTATLDESVISGNAAASAGGGFNNTGTLSLTNSDVHANTASQGGGISTTSGSVTLKNDTLLGNSSSTGSNLYDPGGASVFESTVGAPQGGGTNCYPSSIDGPGNVVDDDSCGITGPSP